MGENRGGSWGETGEIKGGGVGGKWWKPRGSGGEIGGNRGGAEKNEGKRGGRGGDGKRQNEGKLGGKSRGKQGQGGKRGRVGLGAAPGVPCGLFAGYPPAPRVRLPGPCRWRGCATWRTPT